MTTDPETDTQGARRAAALRAMARELRVWAAVLPVWDPIMSPGTLDGFRHALRSAERGLVARLRSLPGCSLGISPDGVRADLELAGVRVRSDAGLRGACAAWATKAEGPGFRRGRTGPP